ncbi:MAG: lysylphosphatidylglycerol synthase domain-containing protein [Gelidibacter sp.]
MPYKTKQFLVVLIKLSIVVGAFYFIYHKLVNNTELEFRVFFENSSKNDVFSVKNGLILMLLTIFNWFFEILKWKQLVAFIQNISLKNAMEQSLGALTASLLTPNRIGEYGAKAMFYKKDLRKKIMLLNLIGNMVQMTTTVILGIVGLVFLSKNHTLQFDFQKILWLGLFGIFLLSFIYFSLKKNRFEVKGFSLKKIMHFVYYVPSGIKIQVSVFSVVRYMIFSFQFYYLLQIFGVPIDYFHAMTVITSMYLLSSIIPSLFIFDVVIKGSVAVYLFSLVGVNDLTILCIVTLMWLLNFVIPSIFGSFYVLHFNLPKDEQTL